MFLQNIRAITFDAGNTLLFPDPSVGYIYAEVLRNYGLDLEPQTLNNRFKKSWEEVHKVSLKKVNEEDNPRGNFQKH